MKPWLAFVIGAGVCWGTYVPLIAYGGKNLGVPGQAGMSNRFAAILCVGAAYVVLGVLFPLGYFWFNGTGNARASAEGITFASLAGAAGAAGAICVVFATAAAKVEDRVYIAPLIFGLAPLINTLVSLVWHPGPSGALHFSLPERLPGWQLYAGILFTAIGAALVLYAKEATEQSAPPKAAAPAMERPA
jgi:hypothetical protein